MTSADPNSYGSIIDCPIVHIVLDLKIDFHLERLVGFAILYCRPQPTAQELVFDSRALEINSIIDEEDGSTVPYTVDAAHDIFGSAVHVPLPAQRPEICRFRVLYSTTHNCTAAQWLKPAQTSGKVHPFFFTQCQAIHARSLLPCQDCPAIKASYHARLTVPQALRALMSANHVGIAVPADIEGWHCFEFDQPHGVPSYLIAIACGALESKEIGPRSAVWCEKEVLEASAYEFAETENFLAIAESLAGPYEFGRYDLLVLPPAFPYGGMENVSLTFLTPTLLAGDRSLASVVAHEISHSWTGNLVTNKTWEHFWLNEGWTVFLERKIIGRMFGEQQRHFNAIGGWKALSDSVTRFGLDHEFTKLIPKLQNCDPDDAFSSVPYEKGFNFLFYLETLIGIPLFEKYMLEYTQHFKWQSITTAQWQEHFLQFCQRNSVDASLLQSVDWDAWLHQPGMPPVTPQFDRTLATECRSLAERWSVATVSDEGIAAGFNGNEMKAFSSSQVRVFLEDLQERSPLDPKITRAMDALYDLSHRMNADIRFAWQMLCLKAQDEDIVPHVVKFITTQGRMKYVRPLYRALNAFNHSLAQDTFQSHANELHPIAATMVARDLGVSKK